MHKSALLTFGLVGTFGIGTAMAANLSGAIFTTLEDGSRVNANIYEDKEDVYLDGGPRGGSPSMAAGLPEGDYHYQVTDPSGQDLLSEDHISCRKIHVNADGVIDTIYAGNDWDKIKGTYTQIACQHAQGVDIDYPELGAVTVQLYPYDNTPNQGGVYKVWITPVADYMGDADAIPGGAIKVNGEEYLPGYYHGFIPADSKTDNYKVNQKGPHTPPMIYVDKFHDANANGLYDADELGIDGWQIAATDPLGATNYYTTYAEIMADQGDWLITEDTPEGTLQTALYLDGVGLDVSPSVTVTVDNYRNEDHYVVFGNVGLGEIEACKVNDANGDGVADAGEIYLDGWAMQLDGLTVNGDIVGPIVQSTSGGCTLFDGLLPGDYTVTELFPTEAGWVATGDVVATTIVESFVDGATMYGTADAATFTNACWGAADFGTKGYWHNNNGMAEISEADIAYVNGLAVYATASSYYGAGDEPFDGYYADGTPVDSVNGTYGEILAPAGSAIAEISHFLVDTNMGADPHEQLAQQLLAFIFNVRHRLDAPEATMELPDGSYASGLGLIEEAVYLWEFGTDDEVHTMQALLDSLNNQDAQPFIYFYGCGITY